MNELTIQEQPAISLVEIRADDKRFPRLHSYPQETAIKMMSMCVLRAAKYYDADLTMDSVNQIAFDLYTELMGDVEGLRTQNITFEEILRSIRKAATGQSVEYYGKVSFHFLYKVIMHYIRNEVMTANQQMLRLAETNRQQLYTNKAALLTGGYARQMITNKQ